MIKEIDARGLACPAPVLQTKAVIDQGDIKAIKVMVDNEASKENVCRFLEHSRFQTIIDKQNDYFIVYGTFNSEAVQHGETAQDEKAELKKIMVMCASDRIGFGDDELGLKLMISFIKTLKEMGPELWRLVFVNNGVKLTIEGSEVLQILQDYDKQGIHILVCGTCLTHYNLLEKKKVGETTNMLDIVTAMQLADKVINL
ncbi:MAG: sulfurtransferase-like selenium metabolism protein YedF [Desulfobacterales bacterium]|nr:sulfurtransferase-like selenium metabolism protein YedF [Desulfobacterales bacterium]